MKTLLHPTDFSSNADTALEFAVETAIHLNAELIIFHSYHSFYPGPNVSNLSVEKIREEDLEKLLAVKDLALQKAGGREISIRVESRPGLAADEIVAYADEIGAEFIVMGTKGASGLEEALLGSVTSNVVEKTNVPVLVVPETAEFKNFNHMAYALDLEEENRLIVSQFLKFASTFDAKITAVHVYDQDEEVNIPSMEELRDKNPELFHYGHVDFQAEIYDEVVEGLEAFMDREQPGVLAVYSRHRGWLGRLFHPSITKKLACHTKIPLLAFHE